MTATTSRGASVLVVDNYDSFTWNIVQYLQMLGADVEVVRNDEIPAEAIADRAPDRLLISPGPCDPDRAGISMEAIRLYAGEIPILGVCLGHQSIGQVFGGRVVSARRLMHGKVSPIHHEGAGVFRGLPRPFPATRYHSLAVAREDLPDVLEVTAWTEDGEIMGLRHRELAVEGVQFHPESILTEGGMDLLRNFLFTSQPDASGWDVNRARPAPPDASEPTKAKPAKPEEERSRSGEAPVRAGDAAEGGQKPVGAGAPEETP